MDGWVVLFVIVNDRVAAGIKTQRPHRHRPIDYLLYQHLRQVGANNHTRRWIPLKQLGVYQRIITQTQQKRVLQNKRRQIIWGEDCMIRSDA